MTGTVPPRPKASWPLFVVCALAFVPFMGILFGGVGATWGFVSSRQHAIKAALVAMVGALLNMVFIVVVAVRAVPDAADRSIAQRELLQLVAALDKYHDEGHPYPTSLEALRRQLGPLHPIPLFDQSAGAFRFQAFQYLVAPDGESYDLFSAGPDKKPGTADDIRPVIPGSKLEHTGYRPHASGEKP